MGVQNLGFFWLTLYIMARSKNLLNVKTNTKSTHQLH